MYRNYRYEFDKTAHNPDNRVVGEEHTTIGESNGVIVPTYTPFYAENLIIKTATATLVRGRDYYVGELASEVTVKTGHEASNTILITSPQTDPYTIEYQCVGGPYLNVIPTISRHDGIVYDGPIDWHSIVNTPDLYPPTPHPHEIDDVVGWGYLVEALERIRQAIIMSNIPAYEYLIEWVSDAIENYPRATCSDIAWGDPIKKQLSLGMYQLMMRTNPTPKEYYLYNIRLVVVNQIRAVRFRLHTKNVTNGIRLLPMIRYTKGTLSVLAAGEYAYCVENMMQVSIPTPPAVIRGDGWGVSIRLVNVYSNELDLCDLEYEYDDLLLEQVDRWHRRCRTFRISPLSYYLAN